MPKEFAAAQIGVEPIVSNLGHAYRKQGKYELAIVHYNMALGYSPREASTFAALGFAYHLKGDTNSAIESYHKALGLKPEDTFVFQMLNKALEESVQQGSDQMLSSGGLWGMETDAGGRSGNGVGLALRGGEDDEYGDGDLSVVEIEDSWTP